MNENIGRYMFLVSPVYATFRYALNVAGEHPLGEYPRNLESLEMFSYIWVSYHIDSDAALLS